MPKGNPGVKNPKKQAGGSFQILAKEPKGSNLCVRPPVSLEKEIREALSKSGLKVAEFLELAAIAYLERSPEQMQQELELLLEQKEFNVDPSKPLPKNARKSPFPPPGKNLDVARQQLEQGQLSSGDNSRTEEPAATASDEAPASRSRNTGGEENQASDTKTSSKGKTRPRTGTKTRKATRG